MKFYTIQHNGFDIESLGVFTSPEEAMEFLKIMPREGDISEYKVQEYEGWATFRNWRYVENF